MSIRIIGVSAQGDYKSPAKNESSKDENLQNYLISNIKKSDL